MLSEEEKEALKNFKTEYETCDHYSSDLIIELHDAEIILNIIEKQQKEIEELKDRNKELTEAIEEWINGERIPFNCVSKDKIKAKIENIKDYYEKEVEPEMYHWGDFTVKEHYSDVIAVLNELMEE